VPPQELLEQRWNGVEEAAKQLTAPALLTLLRLFSIRQEPGFKAPEFLDAAFRSHDTTFPTSGNLEELRVLSGAILRQSISSGTKSAIPAALGLVTASFGRRSNLPTVDHIDAAERFLAQYASNMRTVTSPAQTGSIDITKERFDELMPATVFAASQNVRDPLFNTLNEQATKVTKEITKACGALWRIIQTQREELNLLWWLQAKFSRSLKQPFRDLPLAEAALVLASEAAVLTEFVPGPEAILGILVASLECVADQKPAITILEAVTATPRSWRVQCAEQTKASEVGELCPILLAVTKSLETEGDVDWVPVYRRYCDVGIDTSGRPVEIAHQFYQELLFSRALGEMK
jgi:hypothetical protein